MEWLVCLSVSFRSEGFPIFITWGWHGVDHRKGDKTPCVDLPEVDTACRPPNSRHNPLCGPLGTIGLAVSTSRRSTQGVLSPLVIYLFWSKHIYDLILFLVADMSNVTEFKVFYGVGEIRHGPNGVNLSSFPVTSLQVENPEGYRMKQMIKRLTRWF